MAKDPQSRLAEILGQEYRSKGAISGLASALGKRAKEKFDPRNILFGGTGVGSKVGQKIFGKGYKATPERTVARIEKDTTSIVSEEVISKLEKLETDLEIVAKKSISIPVMARDINIMKQNIAKMTNAMTKGKAVKRSEVGFRSKVSEKKYEKEAGKISESKTPTPVGGEAKPAAGGETGGVLENIFSKMFGDMSSIMGEVFSPNNLLMAFQMGLKAFPVLALTASVINGVYEAWTEYKKSGDLSKASLKYLSGITFGLLSPEWFQVNVITPIVDFIEKVVGLVSQYIIDPIANVFSKVKKFLGDLLNNVLEIISKIGIPRYEKKIPPFGTIGIGPYYPFSGIVDQPTPAAPGAPAPTTPAAPPAPPASAPAVSPAAPSAPATGATPSPTPTPAPTPAPATTPAPVTSAPTPAATPTPTPSGGTSSPTPTPGESAEGTAPSGSAAQTPPSPGAQGSPRRKTEGIVFHHTGGRSVQAAISTLKQRGLAYHYMIDRDGKVIPFMPDNAVAYHAGKTDKNPKFGNWNTIGIAAAANDNDDVTPEQQASAARLAKELSQKYGFDIQNVFGHGQVSSQKMATEGGALVSAVKGGATQVAPAPASGVSIASASTAVEDGQRRQTLGSTTGSNTVVSSNTTNVKKSDTIRRDEFHDTTLIRNVYGV